MDILNSYADEQERERSEWQRLCKVNNMDASMFDAQRLLNSILPNVWQRHAEIIPDYLPPFPSPDMRPKVVVRWKDLTDPNAKYRYLRYSKGPAQGYFWDIGGEDFSTPELAAVALSMAPPPSGSRFNFILPRSYD